MSAADGQPASSFSRTGNWNFAVSIALLVLRLALGWIFIFHGAQKCFGVFGGFDLAKFADGLHLPALPPIAWAYLAAYGEFAGGIMVLLGLLGRFGALLIIIIMSVAISTFTGKMGFSGYEFNLALIAQATAILITGPGLISLDALIFRRGLWARGPQPLSNPSPRP